MSDPSTTNNDGVHPLARRFSFLDAPSFRRRMWIVLGLLTLAVTAYDFIADRHDYLAFAETPAFYALAGFGAFTFVVLMGWPLRRLLSRRETYYSESDKNA